MLKAKPVKDNPHRVRSVMQLNYFIEKGAMDIDKDGIMHLDLDKMVPAAKEMLTDIVKLYLSKDPQKGAQYVDKYFKWTENIDQAAKNIETVDKKLYGKLEQPLADMLLAQD